MIQQNSFPQELDSLRIPSIAGELRMYSNRGFFDFEALEWAQARVAGRIDVQGNTR